jgi:predicted DsbA family dithiol-disulfide isomerase
VAALKAAGVQNKKVLKQCAMKVEIWSDIVCPFCYIGKRKFEKALETFDQREEVEIVWRSFQLDPGMVYVPGQTVHEYLGKRKGVTAAAGKSMNDSMAAMAKEVGLQYNFDEAVINNTLNAHRLLHLAKSKGVQSEMKERLFRAYYTEGRNVGDIETLAELGAEVGLNGEEIKAALQRDDFTADVQDDQYEARQVGVQGVPFFVFNNKYAVSGAQQPDVFRQVLETVAAEEKPLVGTGDSAGSCTVDGVCN